MQAGGVTSVSFRSLWSVGEGEEEERGQGQGGPKTGEGLKEGTSWSMRSSTAGKETPERKWSGK